MQKKTSTTIAALKSKLEYGDYVTLAKMLNVANPVTAKMRFLRGNSEAIDAVEEIVRARAELIKNFKK